MRLLIVDPIVSAVAGDSHKNAEVRRGLQPLVDLASSMRCALLGITHLAKGSVGRDPVERLTGSLAFGALARIVMVAAKRQAEDDGRTVRLFCRAKSNVGPDHGGFEYELHQAELKTHPGVFASAVLWGEAVDGAARELLATAEEDDKDGGGLADAKQFLADLLANGPVPAKTITAEADGAGFSLATIRRAKKALGIEAVKEGGPFAGGQRWVWRLPEDAHEHLQRKPRQCWVSPEGAHLAQSWASSAQLSTFNAEDAQHRALDHLQQQTAPKPAPILGSAEDAQHRQFQHLQTRSGGGIEHLRSGMVEVEV